MKSILFALVLRIISFGLLLKSEISPNVSNKQKQNEIISKINSFSGFWQISLTKAFKGITILGYKQEAFDKNAKIYAFKYKFINITGLILPIKNLEAQGKVYLDNNFNIRNLETIIGNKYLINANIETGNILKIKLTEIGNINPIFSKLIKVEDFNLNFFLIYSLPYLNLDIGKRYVFKTIDILSIKNDKINYQNIYVKNLGNNKFEIESNGLKYKLSFNKNNILYFEENPIYTATLIKNNEIINNLIQKIEGSYNIKKEKINKNNKITKKLDNFVRTKTGNILIHTGKVLTSTGSIKQNTKINKNNILDVDIKQIIQKIQKEKEKTYCEIIQK